MAVFWLVFDGAEGQMRMISVLATPARGRWVTQCLRASLSDCKEQKAVSQSATQLEHSRKIVDRHLRQLTRPPTPP